MKKKLVLVLTLVGFMITAHAAHTPDDTYFVVLAGGNGERLWPLSRMSKPKQLLAVGSELTLLEQAVERAACLVPRDHILISTTQQHAASVRQTVGETAGAIIVEPGSRNTGPAILLCCFEVLQKNPHATIVFVPADPFIPETHKFVGFMEHALDFVRHHNSITLLGMRPTFPATGYGYIEYDPQRTSHIPYQVTHFREKPSYEIAQQYMEAGNVLWNIGIFAAKVQTFIEEFKRHAPEIYDGVVAYRAGTLSYSQIKSDSVDYAVMEKTDNVFVLPVDFTWCDVGNIEVFLSLQKDYKQERGSYLEFNARNNLVDVPHKMVALVGVDDLCVVETADALLIVKRDQAEHVRGIVKQLKANPRYQHYLE